MTKPIIAFALLFSCANLSAQWKYPPTKKEAVNDTYFGTTYTDNYRWLEDFKDPTVVSWFKDQAELTNTTMNKISGRNELIAEWKSIDKLQPPTYRGRSKYGGRVFYQKTMPGEKVSKTYYREGINGAEQLLFDPET